MRTEIFGDIQIDLGIQVHPVTPRVQHLSPPLNSSLNRESIGIMVSAPIAKPVRNGNISYIKSPTAQMWFLFYAQAAQIDGGVEKRSILVA